jgi:hypothetical protein
MLIVVLVYSHRDAVVGLAEDALQEGRGGGEVSNEFQMSGSGQLRSKLNKPISSCVGMDDGKEAKFMGMRG